MNYRPEMLEKIRTWQASDLDGLMAYVRRIWEYVDIGYFEKSDDGIYRLSTGGWSDNEEIISVMQDNYVWWALHWLSSRRGGHYEFGRKKHEEGEWK